jgi:hypothetical protein
MWPLRADQDAALPTVILSGNGKAPDVSVCTVPELVDIAKSFVLYAEAILATVFGVIATPLSRLH